ncbi:MAG: GNAT family N-acetyltransferase, partial [Methanobacteriota archaeon]
VHSGLPLRFWRVPADSPVVEALKNAYRGRGIVRCQPTAGVPSLPLDESWTEPERHLDKRRRSNLRRARRIAEGLGPVTAEILSPKPHEVGPLLDEAYALEEAGWKGRSGIPLARAPLTGTFFRRYATAAAEEGVLRVSFLRIGGRAAAMKIATITGNRFWLLAMGFSEEFEECSPGTLLLVETIRYAARLGLRSYEFLGADEPWIRPWTQLLRPCVSLRTYPLSAPGVVALASDAAALVRARVKSIASAVPRAARALERHNALAYVAGPKIEDAARACRSVNEKGLPTTIGYVTGPNDSPRTVARRYMTTIDAIADDRLDCYLSVKAPELRFSRDLFREVADHARTRGVGLHFDAMGSEDVDETFTLINELRARHADIGCTLPGRWGRSGGDADRAIDLNLRVRVVKGEWADRWEREVDPTAGSLAIIDRIAGRVPHVAVATHDPWLARTALRRLRSPGTPCELEVLMGYPFQRVLPHAKAEGVPVRMYIPYGSQSPPYSLSQVMKKPRIAAWAIRDLYKIARSRTSRSSGVAGPDPGPRGDDAGTSMGTES